MMKTHAHNYFTYSELNVHTAHTHSANERDVLVVVVVVVDAVFVVAA